MRAERRIEIFDTTLRDGEQSPGAAMSPSARLRIARMLDAARVDTIEAGFPAASPLVARSVKQIATYAVHARVAALARCTRSDIDVAADGVRGARRPRIHVFIATSDVHLQHKLRLSRERAIEAAVESVQYARRFCDDVEFSAEDATRSEPAFLARVFGAVIAAGAGVINVPDTVGYTTPNEMSALITYLRQHVEGIEGAVLSVHTHDDLGMATANALAAVQAGAQQVECTINGIGERAGNCGLEEIVCAIRTRRDVFACDTAFDTSGLQRLSRIVSVATGMPVQKNKAIVGANAFSHESGIHQDGVLKERSTYEIIDPGSVGLTTTLPLGRNSGRHALLARATRLGIRVDASGSEAFERAFKEFAQHRRTVRDSDLIRIAAEAGYVREGAVV
ncbi:MAG: 2-isopropylmalate synthase [Vulcanimicrobiaceae bacterium]